MRGKSRMPMTSADVVGERVEGLRELFPEVFCEGRVDFERLRQALGEVVDPGRERYGLSWAGKSEAIRAIPALSVGTLRPVREESVNFDATENLIIEGDNLEVLKLLQKSYHGKVKMIYIDPPYNTGNEFIYPDNFREGLQGYLRYSGQVSGDGFRISTNTETDGRYHSKWLNMMYPRLFLAKNLLREDGVIFVSIDDHEVHNLRLLMNEIFGEENFVANIVWQKTYSPANDKVGIDTMHDSLLCYIRNGRMAPNLLPRSEKMDSAYTNPDQDPRGPWKAVDATRAEHRDYAYYPITTPAGNVVYPARGRSWSFRMEELGQLLEDGRLWFGADGRSKPSIKRFLTEVKQGVVPTTWWAHADAGHNDEAKKEVKALFPDDLPFQTPKPCRLVTRMLQIATSAGSSDLVLDFFAGSGTTAQAVLELNREDGGNRKFMLVQLPEPTGNKQFPTIAEITKERVRRVIRRMEEGDAGKLPLEGAAPQDRGFKVLKLTPRNFKIWDGTEAAGNAAELAEQLALFADNLQPESRPEDVLFEILLKGGYDLNAKLEVVTVGGQSVYLIDDGALVVCLEPSIGEETLRGIAAMKPRAVICLDSAFHGNDQLLTNAELQLQDAGVLFQTV